MYFIVTNKQYLYSERSLKSSIDHQTFCTLGFTEEQVEAGQFLH